MLKVLKPTSSFINCHKCSTSNSPPNAAISVQCVPRNIQKCFLPTELASTSLLLERWSNQFLKMRLESELAIPATLLILKIWVSQNPKVTQQKWLIFVGIWGWTSIYCIWSFWEISCSGSQTSILYYVLWEENLMQSAMTLSQSWSCYFCDTFALCMGIHRKRCWATVGSGLSPRDCPHSRKVRGEVPWCGGMITDLNAFTYSWLLHPAYIYSSINLH